MGGMTHNSMSVVQCPEKLQETTSFLTPVISPEFQVPVSQWEHRDQHR